MNAITKERYEDEKDFEEELNRVYEPVSICGMLFDQGTALKELDPIAFRFAMNDNQEYTYFCSECNKEYDEEDEAEECCKDESEE